MTFLGSFRWYWTAQIAFNFKYQPRVFNFDFNHYSYYFWRDPLYTLANCHFILIGSRDQFEEDKIKTVMNVSEIKYFSVKPYDGIPLVYIVGKMKCEEELKLIFDLKNKD